MVWDEHASNMIPLVKRLDYYEDYERAVFARHVIRRRKNESGCNR